PARQDLLERAVEHIADHARIDVPAKLPLVLPTGDDPLEPGEGSVDLHDTSLQVRATRDLANEHAHEIGIAAPRSQKDLRDAGEAIARGFVCLLHRPDSVEHVTPGLAEDRLEQLLLRSEIVIEQPVGDTRLLGDVTDTRRVIALAREDAHSGIEDEAPLVLMTCRTVGQG